MSRVLRAEQVSLIVLARGVSFLDSCSFWRSMRQGETCPNNIWSFRVVAIISVLSILRKAYSGQTNGAEFFNR